jgi:hypothetical protein
MTLWQDVLIVAVMSTGLLGGAIWALHRQE